MTSDGKATLVATSNTVLAIKNSAFAFLAITTQLLGSTVVFLVIARMEAISISDFGRLTYAFALAQLIVIVFEYGLVPYFSKEIASRKATDHHLERAGYGLHLSLMLIGIVFYQAIVWYMSLDPVSQSVCQWIGASVFVSSSARFFYAYYQGYEKHHIELYSTISEVLIQIVVITSLFFLATDIQTVAKYYFFGRLISWCLAYLIYGMTVSWLVPAIQADFWQRTLIAALPFNLTFITAFAITSIDTLMLQALASDNAEYQVGLYQAAIKLVLIPTILATVVTRVFLPQLARIGQLKSENTQTHLQYLNNILLNIGVLAGLFFYFRAENLTVLAYGQPYRDAAELVALLAITLSLRFGAAYNLYFTLRDMVWLRVLFAIVALTTLITANYLLIPTYGALGAVYASVVTHLVYWIPILVAMRFFEGQALLGWRWLYTLSIAGGYATFLYLSQTLSIWLVSILSVPFTVAVLAYSLPKDTREGLLRSITGAAASKPTSL